MIKEIEELRKQWKDAAIIEAAEQYTNKDETISSIENWTEEKQKDFAHSFVDGNFLISSENR